MRTKKFAWTPTPVYSSRYYRAGFRWMRFVWKGEDGKFFVTKEELR